MALEFVVSFQWKLEDKNFSGNKRKETLVITEKWATEEKWKKME